MTNIQMLLLTTWRLWIGNIIIISIIYYMISSLNVKYLVKDTQKVDTVQDFIGTGSLRNMQGNKDTCIAIGCGEALRFTPSKK